MFWYRAQEVLHFLFLICRTGFHLQLEQNEVIKKAPPPYIHTHTYHQQFDHIFSQKLRKYVDKSIFLHCISSHNPQKKKKPFWPVNFSLFFKFWSDHYERSICPHWISIHIFWKGETNVCGFCYLEFMKLGWWSIVYKGH